MNDFEIVRIFLKEETEQLRNMQLSAPEFLQHYPKHPEWLAKAIREVLEGMRTAFGVLKYGVGRERKPKIDLVGSIILKQSEYAPFVELKNLYMRPDARGKGYGRELYRKTEEYCAKKGYTTIQTEVPCEEIGTIGFLHKMGFKVIDMEPSPYKKGEHIYQMSKNISVMFNGDVFDFPSQAQWVLENYYGYLKDSVQEHKPLKLFSLEPIIPDCNKVTNNYLQEIKGAAAIIDEPIVVEAEKIKDVFATSNAQLRMLFVRNIGSTGIRYCAEAGIKCFDVNGFYELFKEYFAYKRPSFERVDIAGMVLVFKPELFARIGKAASTFTYFKGGPTGKYLQKGHKALLYVESTAGHPREGLCGIAEIVDITIGSSTEVWRKFANNAPLFKQTEYSSFAKSKTCIIGIAMTNFLEFSPVSLDQLNEVIGTDIDIENIGHLYVDKKAVEWALKHSASNVAKGDDAVKYKVALSFAGEDREHAHALADFLRTNGVEVFYDEYEQANLWGKDLYQHLQKVYRDDANYCVVFLSQHYAKKVWTKHELKQAQARAFRENREYILPVKIDDTEIPGINETVGYLDLRQLHILKIGELLLEKLLLLKKLKKS